MLKFCYCFRGGHLYRKERKKRVKTEHKPVVEPENNSLDVESMVEDNNVPVPGNTILLPKRILPDLDFPDNLKYETGYNCHLAHDKKIVRNIHIEYNYTCYELLQILFQLVQLPCQPNVVTLLENYLKYLARNNFSDNKATKKSRQPEVLNKQQLEKR